MKPMTLRYDIRREDRDAIVRITTSSGFFSRKEITLARRVFDDTLMRSDTGYRYVLAEIEADVVGYACWGRDEITESSYELYWLAVDDAWRWAGIGKRLLASVEATIREEGHGQLFIETAGRAQYAPTRRFYEKQGYAQAALLPDYYAPGDARVIFAKRV